jgi:hypothetical protein
MEYCSGGDLSRFIQTRRQLPENIAKKFLQQLGRENEALSAFSFLKNHNQYFKEKLDGIVSFPPYLKYDTATLVTFDVFLFISSACSSIPTQQRYRPHGSKATKLATVIEGKSYIENCG